MAAALIGLGSNLGDRSSILHAALTSLDRMPGIRVVATSAFRETLPASVGRQPPFLNAASRLESTLSPDGLLQCLQSLERQMGRMPGPRWAPRPIDLDLLLYDGLVLELPQLIIPHPRMTFRRFVLEPASEVGGAMIHPLTQWTVSELAERLDSSDEYIAITGPPGVGKSQLAQHASVAAGMRFVSWPSLAHELSGTDCELARLRSVESLLSRVATTEADARGLVSDFWLGQLLAYAQWRLGDSLFSQYRDSWRRVDACVARPRLLIFLDRAASHSDASGGDPAVRDGLWQKARLPRQVPVLKLDSRDLDWAKVEIVAAAQAMH